MSDQPVAETSEALNTYAVSGHVLLAKAELHRATLGSFAQAREQFIAHLRPPEVAGEIGREICGLTVRSPQFCGNSQNGSICAQ